MNPKPLLPDVNAWEHAVLHRRIVDALAALPTYFRTETFISGIPVPDLHTLHGALGASIEEQTVATLNAMRTTWDPDGQYALYTFIRQPQTFPDVLLRRPPSPDANATPPEILLGIELKGWYLLANEGEPNFRYVATRAASGQHDLLVVVPWVLAQVISGHPIVFTPAVVGTRIAAKERNAYWRGRTPKGDPPPSTDIVEPTGIKPYMGRGAINDVPVADAGGNFGRIARSRVLDEYVKGMQASLLCGVAVKHWHEFFLALSQGSKKGDTAKKLHDAFAKIAEDVAAQAPLHHSAKGAAVETILDNLRTLVDLPGDDW